MKTGALAWDTTLDILKIYNLTNCTTIGVGAVAARAAVRVVVRAVFDSVFRDRPGDGCADGVDRGVSRSSTGG